MEENIISSTGALQQNALAVLKNLAGKDLVNKQTGIKAQINSEQRSKIICDKAVEKTIVNGFIAKQHYAVALNIEKIWENAIIVADNPDKKNDKNIISIKIFESSIILDNEQAIAYITVKESIKHGHRIYSLELQEIIKSVVTGGTLSGNEGKRTTPHGKPLIISDDNHLFTILPKTE